MRRLERVGAAGAVVALAATLAACQQSGSGRTSQWAHLSPAGQTIAFEAIEGPPTDIRSELVGELASAASSRRVDIASDARSARFRVKGYLTTETGEDGVTSLAFVWDVFDSNKRRAQRVTGSSPIRAAPSDAWQALDREALRALAERSMDEIAVFLASRNDPDAPG